MVLSNEWLCLATLTKTAGALKKLASSKNYYRIFILLEQVTFQFFAETSSVAVKIRYKILISLTELRLFKSILFVTLLH